MPKEKKYPSPEELEEKINEYFEQCRKTGVFADEAAMMLSLNLLKSDITKLCRDEDYAEVFERAALRRRSQLERAMVSDNKKANGCMNALKQLHNGGYTDKPIENADRTVKVVIEGGHGSELFK